MKMTLNLTTEPTPIPSPPAITTPCTVVDVNDDNEINLSDTLLILDHFGDPGGSIYDIDGVYDVDLSDALYSLSRFGETCDHL